MDQLKYTRAIDDLRLNGEASMQCRGSSMLPILSNPSLCHYRAEKEYVVGDIVFCRVRGRYIDAHKVTAFDTARGRYLISNNHGHDNGWTRTIYGRVVVAEQTDGTLKKFPRKGETT